MSTYIDLHQNDLLLSLLQQYLLTGEELILTDTQQPIAKVTFFQPRQKAHKKPFRVRDIDLGEDVTINRETLYYKDF
jgi:hypothetical protein